MRLIVQPIENMMWLVRNPHGKLDDVSNEHTEADMKYETKIVERAIVKINGLM